MGFVQTLGSIADMISYLIELLIYGFQAAGNFLRTVLGMGILPAATVSSQMLPSLFGIVIFIGITYGFLVTIKGLFK